MEIENLANSSLPSVSNDLDSQKPLDSAYLSILTNISSQINWLTFTVLIIVGTNIFLLYQHHFGALEHYIKREQHNLSNSNNLSSLTNSLSNTHHFTDEDIFTRKKITERENDTELERYKKLLEEAAKASPSPTPNKSNTLIVPTPTPNVEQQIYQKIVIERARLNSENTDQKAKNDITSGIVKDKLEAFNKLKNETDVITLPIIGIPLIKRDFFILYLIMGTLFLGWIYTLLSYSRNFLENLFNESKKPTDLDANSIQSLMFLIMPNDYTSRFYFYYEVFLLLFPTTIVFFIISDLWDIWANHNLYNMPLSDNPSFAEMSPHLWAAYIITILCLIFSVAIYMLSKNILFHIRNKLILFRWTRTALIPAITDFVVHEKKSLEKGKSLIEYRVCDSSGKHKLVVNLLFEGEKNPKEISAVVNLPHSIRKFYAAHKRSSLILSSTYDKEKGRANTKEESLMKAYFKAILNDPAYEKDLRSEISTKIH